MRKRDGWDYDDLDEDCIVEDMNDKTVNDDDRCSHQQGDDE